MRRVRLHDDDILVVAICLAVAVVPIGAVTAIWIMSGVPEKAFPKMP